MVGYAKVVVGESNTVTDQDSHLSLYKTTLKMLINDVVSMQIYLPVDKWGCPVNANERTEFHPIYGLDAAKSFQLFAMV